MDVQNVAQDRIRANIKVNAQGCWEWQLFIRRNGYGQMKYEGKTVDAHRVSYRCFHGEIPEGMDVLHSCDNRRCANPDHLRLGTHKENMEDMVAKGRQKKSAFQKEHLMHALALRYVGFTYKQIGVRMGFDTMSVHKYCNAPSNDNEVAAFQLRVKEAGLIR